MGDHVSCFGTAVFHLRQTLQIFLQKDPTLTLIDTECIPEGEVAMIFDISLQYVESHINMGGGRGLTRPSESST